jgi:glucose-6-phosphate isomerase
MLKKSIVYDYNNVLSDRITSSASATLEELESYADKTVEIHNTLTIKRKKGELPFYELPYQKQELSRIKSLANSIKKEMGDHFENLLVIGIGGSSLGGIALLKALNHPFYNLLPKAERKTPRVFYAENIDADEVKGLFDILEPEKTVVNIISKSGTTAEPMANFLLFQKFMVDKIGEERFKKQVVATTDPKKGTMREIVNDMGLSTLNIPDGVGGRFSVLTPVGLFPAYLAGIDVDTLLEGAGIYEWSNTLPLACTERCKQCGSYALFGGLELDFRLVPATSCREPREKVCPHRRDRLCRSDPHQGSGCN